MCLLLWFHIVDKRNILNSICVQRTAICCNRVFREAGERERACISHLVASSLHLSIFHLQTTVRFFLRRDLEAELESS